MPHSSQCSMHDGKSCNCGHEVRYLTSTVVQLRKELNDVKSMLDRLFHNAPYNKDGEIEANATGLEYFHRLSEWTYKDGKL